MSAEGTFLMICAIIAGLLISSLITYWNRSLFKHMLDKRYILRENFNQENYVLIFFLMYIPILNVLYLLILLIVFEISNLERL